MGAVETTAPSSSTALPLASSHPPRLLPVLQHGIRLRRRRRRSRRTSAIRRSPVRAPRRPSTWRTSASISPPVRPLYWWASTWSPWKPPHLPLAPPFRLRAPSGYPNPFFPRRSRDKLGLTSASMPPLCRAQDTGRCLRGGGPWAGRRPTARFCDQDEEQEAARTGPGPVTLCLP